MYINFDNLNYKGSSSSNSPQKAIYRNRYRNIAHQNTLHEIRKQIIIIIINLLLNESKRNQNQCNFSNFLHRIQHKKTSSFEIFQQVSWIKVVKIIQRLLSRHRKKVKSIRSMSGNFRKMVNHSPRHK